MAVLLQRKPVGERDSWAAVYAMTLGITVTLVDTTAVAVANPVIMADLGIGVTQVIWVTSAYLLGFMVPLLLAGRLGDRFGCKNVYMIGLGVFTAASLVCGLSASIGMLACARAVQGIGAALMTPQPMAVIVRMFPPTRRGAPLGVWGGVAGTALLIGPLAGGVLVAYLGWQWVFFVNIPIGLISLWSAARWVPVLPTYKHRFDTMGVLLSGLGVLLLVAGIQEGEQRGWDPLIWTLIGSGSAVLLVFLLAQAHDPGEPLLPLTLFRDRNFALAAFGIAIMGVIPSATAAPMYFYLQMARGLSTIESALVLAPMAVTVGLCAPLIGRMANRVHPRTLPSAGFALYATAVFGLAILMTPSSSLTWFLGAATLSGLANAAIRPPLAAVATQDMPGRRAGVAAAVYSSARQLGAVLGSAATAAIITSRLAANGISSVGDDARKAGEAAWREPDGFTAALRESMYFPGTLLVAALVAAMFFTRRHIPPAGPAAGLALG